MAPWVAPRSPAKHGISAFARLGASLRSSSQSSMSSARSCSRQGAETQPSTIPQAQGTAVANLSNDLEIEDIRPIRMIPKFDLVRRAETPETSSSLDSLSTCSDTQSDKPATRKVKKLRLEDKGKKEKSFDWYSFWMKIGVVCKTINAEIVMRGTTVEIREKSRSFRWLHVKSLRQRAWFIRKTGWSDRQRRKFRAITSLGKLPVPRFPSHPPLTRPCGSPDRHLPGERQRHASSQSQTEAENLRPNHEAKQARYSSSHLFSLPLSPPFIPLYWSTLQ
eukprot:750192-Hanusia_phi.AAC.1